jgi:hypothetical protein
MRAEAVSPDFKLSGSDRPGADGRARIGRLQKADVLACLEERIAPLRVRKAIQLIFAGT